MFQDGRHGFEGEQQNFKRIEDFNQFVEKVGFDQKKLERFAHILKSSLGEDSENLSSEIDFNSFYAKYATQESFEPMAKHILQTIEENNSPDKLAKYKQVMAEFEEVMFGK